MTGRQTDTQLRKIKLPLTLDKEKKRQFKYQHREAIWQTGIIQLESQEKEAQTKTFTLSATDKFWTRKTKRTSNDIIAGMAEF